MKKVQILPPKLAHLPPLVVLRFVVSIAQGARWAEYFATQYDCFQLVYRGKAALIEEPLLLSMCDSRVLFLDGKP